MALASILNAARSGLAAAEAGLKTGAANVANAGAPGYTRQRVQLTPQVVAGSVVGVSAGDTSRIADRWLEQAVYATAAGAKRGEKLSGYLDRLQTGLGVPGASSGLTARMDALVASATALGTVQGLAQNKGAFVAAADDALRGLRSLNTDAAALRGEASQEVKTSVGRINDLISGIHADNLDVMRQRALGQSAAGVLDRRNVKLEELGGLVAVSVRENGSGAVSVDTAGGIALLDSRPRQLVYQPAGSNGSEYPAVAVRFVDRNGAVGNATGEVLDAPAAGGALGALISLRDRDLPRVQQQLGALFDRLSGALNSAANAGTNVPPPRSLDGKDVGLVGGDRLGFSGRASVAVTTSDGKLVARTDLDLTTISTVDGLVSAINAGLGGAGTASFANGRLAITANGSGRGVAVGQDETAPADRAGQGLGEFFGLNDVIVSESLRPAGFAASDAHGFGAGESAELVLRDGSGREIARQLVGPVSGPTFGDLTADLNAGPLSAYGSFAFDDAGRIAFTPVSAMTSSSLSMAGDTTSRFGTGLGLTGMLGLGRAGALDAAGVGAALLADPTRLPLARLQTGVVGAQVIGQGDTRGAAALSDALGSVPGRESLSDMTGNFVAQMASEARRAGNLRDERTALYQDALNRRDNVSGVNIDEELAQMVVLQNSYAASARMISAANEMYQTLIGMVR